MKKNMISGIMACIIIGILSKFISTLFPLIGATSLAVIIGIISGNTLTKDKKYLPGIKFSEKTILSGAIMFLGASGSSAIAATAPVLGAKEDEIGIPIAIVNLIGTIFMFILPLISFNILGYTPLESGGLIGGGLQSVGQVVAGSNFLGEEATKFSILFKMIRISMLGGVVLVFSFIGSKNSENIDIKKNKLPIPLFIIGFFILSILVTLGILNDQTKDILGLLSKNLLIIAMAAIGMRVKFKELLSEGPRALLFGMIAMFFQIPLLIILIKLILK